MALKLIGLLGHAGAGKDLVADWLVANHGFSKMSLASGMKRFAQSVFDFSDSQLWGPSENRNAVDPRFNDSREWDRALERLLMTGWWWCRFLFHSEQRSVAHDKLVDWFNMLVITYYEKAGNQLSPRVVLQTMGTEWGRNIDPQVWVRATVQQARASVSPVVVSDCRFGNEIAGIKDAGGYMVRVRRPGARLVRMGVAGHASEAEQDTIPDTEFNLVLNCPEGLVAVRQMLETTLSPILQAPSVSS